MRAGRKDLRDLAVHQFSGAGFLGLLANGDFASALQNARDIGIGRVKRQAAHGNAIARGQRKIEDLRAGLRVLEKHLVKIAQPEQQNRILRQFAFDAAILRHHGSELGFGGHAAEKLNVNGGKIE